MCTTKYVNSSYIILYLYRTIYNPYLYYIYYIILYYSILYYYIIILHYIILYHIILYHIILYCLYYIIKLDNIIHIYTPDLVLSILKLFGGGPPTHGSQAALDLKIDRKHGGETTSPASIQNKGQSVHIQDTKICKPI